MDKLQPLIKHRYWICFGLSILFVIVGWWMASGAIAVEIQTRKDLVEKSFETAKQGTTEPNTFWVEQAKKENEEDSAAYKSASAQLLQRQKDARRWPDVLASDLKGVSYRGEIKNPTTRGRWASIYQNEIERLLSIVKPYKNGEGLVVVDTKNITHKPFNSWLSANPSTTEIWDAQEDIWLLQSLLNSIARVNEGATRITESQVRQIFKLNLRGGDRDAAPAASGGGMGDSMSGMAGGMVTGMGMSGGPMGGGTGAAGGSHPGKEFEGAAGSDILTEEFGSFGRAAGGMGGAGMGMGLAMSMGPMSSESGGDGSGAAAEEKRYVDDGADLGYKTRAFLLDVIVRDDQLPNLLASLTNSDFPVEIVRVDISSKLLPGGGAAGGMGGAAGMTGMPGMGPGMMSGMGMGGDDMGATFDPSAESEMAIGPEASFGGDAGALTMPGGDIYAAESADGMGSGMVMPGGMGGMAGYPGGGGAKGKDVLQVAMADPLLIHVKIGGLMTLYQSAQEADAEAAAAQTDEAAAPAPANPEAPATENGTPPSSTETTSPDATMTDAAGNPVSPEAPASAVPAEQPAAEAAEGASETPASPQDTAAPADPSVPAESVPQPTTEPQGGAETPAAEPGSEPTQPTGEPASGT